MGSLAAVCVHDNLAPGQAGVAVRAADDELPCRVHMQDVVILEQGRDLRMQFFHQHRDEDILDVLPDFLLHGRIHAVLTVLVAGFFVGHVA